VQLGDELAEVTIVNVAEPAVLPVMLTGVVALKLNVGGAVAPLGLIVIAAVSTTLPVNPFNPVTAMALVTVPPCATVRLAGEEERLRLGATTVRAIET
jgi:ABC-type phosphate transport system permease subunit